jgi:hypothetical protein
VKTGTFGVNTGQISRTLGFLTQQVGFVFTPKMDELCVFTTKMVELIGCVGLGTWMRRWMSDQ